MLALLALLAHAADTPPADDAFDMDRGAGELADDKIAEVMKKNGWQVADCYAKNAAKGQTGRMMLEFEIAEDGTVKATKRLESSLENPALEDCVAGAVKKYKFPAPVGGTVVKTWPFVF
ncbi:MAG: TonB family protein [Myxococcota bacterium]